MSKIVKCQPISAFYGWTDSSVTLQWTRGGTYKQVVSNRVNELRVKDFINWRYFSTDCNPTDICSRGCSVDESLTEW